MNTHLPSGPATVRCRRNCRGRPVGSARPELRPPGGRRSGSGHARHRRRSAPHSRRAPRGGRGQADALGAAQGDAPDRRRHAARARRGGRRGAAARAPGGRRRARARAGVRRGGGGGQAAGPAAASPRCRSSSSAPGTRCAAASRRCRRGLAGVVVVTYADVPLLDAATLRALLAEHARAGAAVTLLTAEFADPTGYGRVLRGPDGAVTGIVEHGRRHAGAASDPRDQQRRVRVRRRVPRRGPGGPLGPQRAGRALPDGPGGRRRRPGSAGAQRGVPGPVAGPGRERPGPARPGARRAEPAGAGALDARRGDGGGPRDDVGGRRGAAGPGRRAATRAPSCTDPRSSTTARRSGRTPP